MSPLTATPLPYKSDTIFDQYIGHLRDQDELEQEKILKGQELQSLKQSLTGTVNIRKVDKFLSLQQECEQIDGEIEDVQNELDHLKEKILKFFLENDRIQKVEKDGDEGYEILYHSGTRSISIGCNGER